MTPSPDSFLASLDADAALWTDFIALCGFGGRLAGTASEAQAQAWCTSRLEAVDPRRRARQDPTPYAGWTCHAAELVDVNSGKRLDAVPLLGTAATPAGGMELDVVDLGRGTPEQIWQAGNAVRGRAVLVEHEYPFASTTVHRRVKLGAAQNAGAGAFLIAQPEAGVGPVSGSSGRGGGPGIPAMGISAEAAAVLRRERARVRIRIAGDDQPGLETKTLVLDLPGRSPERVVLSAHIDGHPLAESAIDNATGVATALALARAAAPFVHDMERGLTICIFSAEEWALQGSRAWIAGLDAATRANIRLNLNLDSLAGSERLTALTSGFPRLGEFAQRAAVAQGHVLATHLPLMPNSDHAMFAAAGIPAMRLLAGFDEPESRLRLLLTPADTRALVEPGTLHQACRCAGALLWTALTASSADIAALAER
jgi:aminopeptidase YwaD